MINDNYNYPPVNKTYLLCMFISAGSVGLNIFILSKQRFECFLGCGNKQRPPNKNKQRLSRACYSEEVSHHDHHLADLKTDRGKA